MRKEMKKIMAKTMTLAMAASLLSGITPVNTVYANNEVAALEDITITNKPAAGVTAEAKVGEVTLSWSPTLADGKFECGKEYTVSYVINAGTDNTFAEAVVDTDDSDGRTVALDAEKKNATVTIKYEKTSHELVEQEAKAPKCNEDGYKIYYTCSVCDGNFEDNEAANEISDIDEWKDGKGKVGMDTVDHDGAVAEGGAATEATCNKKATLAVHKCSTCEQYYVEGKASVAYDSVEAAKAEAETGDVSSTHAGTKVSAAVTADCVTKAKKAVYRCNSCKEWYVDEEAGTTYSTLAAAEEVATGAVDAGNHAKEGMTFVPYKAASCAEKGNNAYFICACGKAYYAADVKEAKTSTNVSPTGEAKNDTSSFVLDESDHEGSIVSPADVVETPNCVNGGKKDVYQCDTCDKYYVAGVADTVYDTLEKAEKAAKEPVGADNHEGAVKTFVPFHSASCADGTYAHFECECGTWFYVKSSEKCTALSGDGLEVGDKVEADDMDDFKITGIGDHTTTEVVAADDTTSCVKKKSKAIVQCNKCKEYFLADDTGFNTPYTDLEKAKKAAVDGEFGDHDAELEFIPYQKETCAEDGHYAHFQCKTCEKYFAVKNKSHEKATSSENVAANKETAMENEDGFKIAATGTHAGKTVASAAVKATCAVKEKSAVYQCDGCGKYFVDGKTSKVYDTIAEADEAATGDFDSEKHAEELIFVPYKEATCAEEGNYAHFKCEACEALFDIDGVSNHRSDAKEEGELKAGSVYKLGFQIARKDHDFEETIEAQTADCTHDGNEAYKHCKECGLYFEAAADVDSEEGKDTTEDFIIKAKGHTYGDAVVTKEATCTEDGSQKKTCECGDEVIETIPALGHSYGDWEITKAATCGADGSKRRVCLNDDSHVETEVIPATGKHTYGDWTVDVEAAVGKEGKRSHKCSVCGNVESETIPALKEEVSKPVDASKVEAAATGGITPTVTTKASGEAALNSVAKTSKTTVKISEKVTVNGVDYKVTTVEANAFKNCTKVKTIQLPSSIKTVKKNAFRGCKKLKTVKLDVKKSITVKKGAFKGLDTTKMTIKVNKKMSAKELKKFQKALKKAGFKGKVKK